MSFPKYEHYKDSGVEWLGEVPAHWETKRIKHLIRAFEQGWSPQCEGYPVESSEEWGVLKVGCVNGGTFRREENKALPAEIEPVPALGISAGDLLISRANTRELVGSAAVAEEDYSNLLLCDKLYRVRLKPQVCNPRFLGLYLGTEAARGQIELAATGASSSMVNIGQSTILEMQLSLPAHEEQLQIAAFLRSETTKLDALITEQRTLIDLLKEKRQAVISHAVTKGLDPRVPMKDSGVEWMGEVPAHWTVTRIAAISELVQTGPFGSQLHSEEYVEDCTPVINPSNIVGECIAPDMACTLDEGTVGRLSQHKLESGDIVIGRRGEMGRCAVVEENNHGWICGTGSLRLKLKISVSPYFVGVYLRTGFCKSYLSLQSVGSTMDNLSASIISGIPIAVPSLGEQIEIHGYIKSETNRLDDLTAEAQTTIALLQERRSALISAAVTGKIDVRQNATEAA